MFKNLIFDFGGVILKHKTTIMEEIISQLFSVSFKQASEIWLKYKVLLLTGEITSSQFLRQLKTSFLSPLSVHQLLTEWKRLYQEKAKGVNWDLLALIKKLKRSYQVFLFTDIIDVHDAFNRQRHIYEVFNRVFKSYEEGLSKQNPAAFTNLLNKIRAKAQDCLFIDDLEANVTQAKNSGMKGIVFKDNQQLKKNLVAQGISLE